uniref:EGF-like domain-containing protein n=1 Tax=Anopheles epiroticus TaxID=199890 RepID=A0A182PDM4_9DIPT
MPCMCEPGYTGKNCESGYIPCSPSPCQNGGTCKQSTKYSYECKCPPGAVETVLTSIVVTFTPYIVSPRPIVHYLQRAPACV